MMKAKKDETLLMMAKTIKEYCREIGEANLGGDCCKGCVFIQGKSGCVLNACPEQWRLTEAAKREKQETA
jgi:hypothetical protein